MSWPALVSLLAAAALVPACGSDAGGNGGGAEPPTTRLQVQFLPNGDEGETFTATLTCDPAGGDHPRPEEACEALEAGADSLDPVPSDMACTQIYGGPETAVVTGTFRGEALHAEFSRTDGCQIARWEPLDALLRLRD